jgi:hypothetical protein
MANLEYKRDQIYSKTKRKNLLSVASWVCGLSLLWCILLLISPLLHINISCYLGLPDPDILCRSTFSCYFSFRTMQSLIHVFVETEKKMGKMITTMCFTALR